MTIEFDYNGSKGSNLQANLLNFNQVPLSAVNGISISRLGPTAAVALLSMQANSPAAVAAGITIPYANFTNPAIQTTRSVAQALRPFPQYNAINTTNSGGDKTGKSMYHAGVVKLTKRMSDGFLFQGSYTFSKLMTDADTFSGSTGSMDTAQPELEYSIGRLDQTHSIRLNTVYRAAVGPRQAMAQGRRAEPHHRRMANRCHSVLQQRIPAGRHHRGGTAGDFQWHESSERDRRRLARAVRR